MSRGLFKYRTESGDGPSSRTLSCPQLRFSLVPSRKRKTRTVKNPRLLRLYNEALRMVAITAPFFLVRHFSALSAQLVMGLPPCINGPKRTKIQRVSQLCNHSKLSRSYKVVADHMFKA